MIKISKYIKLYSSFFIFVYASFLLIFTLHFHRFDLNEKSEFKDQQKINTALVLDFLSDGLSVCAVNHFSHSILNFSSTSEEINILINSIDLKLYKTDLSKYKTYLLTNLSPRASPHSS